jgi:Holliday junction DNA helicase RuvA
MYNHISGRLVSVDPSCVVLECSGVGYGVRVPLSTLDQLPGPGADFTLLTHLHVREDALDLFGFATERERRMFRRLIAISGVGPSAAMAIMSHCTVADICSAVRRNDPTPLVRAKGVGRKTAERVVLDLKGIIKEFDALAGVPDAAGAGAGAGPDNVEGTTAQALVHLGYTQAEADRAARDAVEELGTASLSDLLREALKRVR